VFEPKRMRLPAIVAPLRVLDLLARLPRQLNVSGLSGDAPVAAERMTVGPRPSAVQQNVPAWLVFGMFFVVASIAGLFVEERACGALARLRSLGARPWQLIVSKICPYLAVNAVQAALMLAVGVWLMPLIGGEGLSLQGVNWAALLLMLLAISLAAVSLALSVACLVSSHAQAATLGPILNVLMAALGGVMVPLFVMPPVMQKIASYSPMNWGLEGLLDVLLRSGDVASVLPQVGRLAGFAALMLMIAFGLFRRRV
jgi:ABC-2 type transport system permease protein